jgi:septal ring factor EnvC (AmiA/AmiB activator)
VRLRGRPGQPVGAVAAGVVRRIEPSPAGGLALVVDHGGGWASLLAGLPPASLPPALAPGARVARGDRVGQLAPAGGGAAEIVLELWRGRTPVDPVRHLPGR